MTPNDIFTTISNRLIEGMMFHDNMADCFAFLGLSGFKRMHEYQFMSESLEMRKVHRYFINHYDVLLQEAKPNSESHIPSGMKCCGRFDISSNNSTKYTKCFMKDWIEWEEGTKCLYEDMAKQLRELKEIAAAIFVEEMVEEVDEELGHAKKLYLKLDACDWDASTVVEIQGELHDKYKK